MTLRAPNLSSAPPRPQLSLPFPCSPGYATDVTLSIAERETHMRCGYNYLDLFKVHIAFKYHHKGIPSYH